MSFTDVEMQFFKDLLTPQKVINKRDTKDIRSNIKKKLGFEFLKPNRLGKVILDEDVIEIIGFKNYTY